MVKHLHRNKRKWLLSVIVVTALLTGAAVTLALMNPGFVECTGYLEPDGWVPLYARSDGSISYGNLEDGMKVSRGELLIVLDDEWPRWNLKRTGQEQKILETEISFLEQSLILFSGHREIEEEELRRLMDADRRLLENSSLTRNELYHTEYLYHTFIAGADREESDLEQVLLLDKLKLEFLRVEKKLWESRLDECRIMAPITGRFYSAETVLSGTSVGLVPTFSPGRRVESGRLLGYLIPEGGMRAHIEIPQHRISGCRPGQPVLLSVDARPQWRFAPVRGRLASIMTVASGGVFHGTVELSPSDQTLEELRDLIFGNLTARIYVGNHHDSGADVPIRITARVWERWSLMVNSIGKIQKSQRRR